MPDETIVHDVPLSAPQIALYRLLHAFIDVPCSLDIFERQVPGAEDAVRSFALANAFRCWRESRDATETTPAILVTKCEIRMGHIITVFL